jgi:hypothetical protein
MKKMSVESKDVAAQDPDFETWHAEKDPEIFWHALIKMHKVAFVTLMQLRSSRQ